MSERKVPILEQLPGLIPHETNSIDGEIPKIQHGGAEPARIKTAKEEPVLSQEREIRSQNDDIDWDLNEDNDDEDERWFPTTKLLRAMRSAFLIRAIEFGLPREQRGMLYFLLIQFHEDVESIITVYSTIPAILMWYYPQISPGLVYSITHSIDTYMRSRHTDMKDIFIPAGAYAFFLWFFANFSFRGLAAEIEPIFGEASKWQGALLPISPGMFLRLVNERPNSINGFVPENKQGILMAIFVRACTAVLPPFLTWPIWVAFSAPSIEHPAMLVDWFFCTFAWIFTKTSPLGAYAIWLLVNQYRHTYTWFRGFGGGPSVILQRERNGTMWYITTVILMQLLELGFGPDIVKSDFLTLAPQTWIPFALIFGIGIYLLQYGLLLRIYKFEHRPLGKGENLRLLRLRAQPCLPNSPIQCDIIHTSLARPPQYVAVSHRWDSSGMPQEMILIDGGLFPVSRSIHSLLLAKRSNLHPRYFWIDSICINQEDNVEKSKQVGLMRNIYEEAEMTLGWLGEAPDAKKVITLIERITNITSANALSSLCAEPDSGWMEFERFMSNEWFERVWIVQEIAAAKVQILRYGDQEIKWSTLSAALVLVMLFAPRMDISTAALLGRREVLSALIMEEIRAHIARVDLIKLKDALKLSLRFNATLPVDKVYALLGLVDERYTPLFHPKFGSANGLLGNKINDITLLAKDAVDTMQLLAEILGTATGRKNSRRGRAILSLGTSNAVRYTAFLNRDLGNIVKRLQNWKEGIPDIVEEPIQPDYTGKTTALLIYTYVARDLVKQGDAMSFIKYAGTWRPRNGDLAALPSWVPDWSTDGDVVRDVKIYLLPWRKYDRTSTQENKDKSSEPQKQPSVFEDGGSKILFVKGLKVGAIEYLAPLAENCDAPQDAGLKEVIKDFLQMKLSYHAALELANKLSASRYGSEDAFQDAFYRTLAADSNSTAGGDPTPNSMKDWTVGVSASCRIGPILLPEEFPEFWSQFPKSDDPEAASKYRESVFKTYLFTRRMQSSANSKFAHLVRTDVAPSFSRYSRQAAAGDSDNAAEESQPSMLSNEDSNPLVKYAPYVDYTIGRSFIVTGEGLMGLAPPGAKEGDILVRVENDGRLVWLTMREEKPPQREAQEPAESKDPNKPDATAEFKSSTISQNESVREAAKSPPTVKDRQPSHPGTFLLVGEAYVHQPDSESSPVEDLKWFELW
ncbi:hypothetical protein MMC25_002929 [Agyrium rufum]|nr:hypothetical protein [Agyrium rufum]